MWSSFTLNLVFLGMGVFSSCKVNFGGLLSPGQVPLSVRTCAKRSGRRDEMKPRNINTRIVGHVTST